MSLLSRNQLAVWLHPKQVAILQLATLKKNIDNKQYASVEPLAALHWQDAIEQLGRMLSSDKFSGNHLNIMLSSDFVRYMILPPHESVQNLHEKSAFARAAFQENYGAVVNDWQVTVDDARPDLNAVAVGVDQALIAALNQIAQTNKVNLISVQPYLMTAYNRIITQHNQSSCYWAVIEKSRLLFAAVQDAAWVQIRNLPLEDNWSQQLEHLMAREAIASSHQIPKRVNVYAPGQTNTALPTVAGWTINQIALPKRFAKAASHDAFSMLEAA